VLYIHQLNNFDRSIYKETHITFSEY